MSKQYLFYLIYNTVSTHNILTILSNLKFKFNLLNKSIYFHYSLYIWKHRLGSTKKIKQEKPEMDDFEEEKKWVLKEKYFEKFNIFSGRVR